MSIFSFIDHIQILFIPVCYMYVYMYVHTYVFVLDLFQKEECVRLYTSSDLRLQGFANTWIQEGKGSLFFCPHLVHACLGVIVSTQAQFTLHTEHLQCKSSASVLLIALTVLSKNSGSYVISRYIVMIFPKQGYFLSK